MEAFLTFLTATLVPALIKILIALVIYWLGNKLIKLLISVTDKAMDKAHLDEGVQSFLKSALKIVLFVVLVFIIISYLGIATTGLAALFASAGVTVGLALQGSFWVLGGLALMYIPMSYTWRLGMEGFLLCMICPTATAAAVITGKLGGNQGSLTMYIILANLMASLLIPAMIPLIYQNSDITFWATFDSF